MEISTKDMKRVSLVTVKGRVDSSTAPDFEKALHSLIQSNRTQIVLDLAGVDYMSSAGIRGMISSLKAAKGGGGDVRLAHPSTRVKDVVELAGLTSIFAIYDDLIEAVGSF
jgi:anti-sigma B factor antagonist